MSARWKRNTVVATMVLLVCAAVALNWKYTGEQAADAVEETGTKILGGATLVSGQEGGGIDAICMELHGQVWLGRQGKELVGIQGAAPVIPDEQGQHPLHGLHIQPGEIVDRCGGAHHDLSQALGRHIGHHPVQALLIHFNRLLSQNRWENGAVHPPLDPSTAQLVHLF